MCVYLCVSSMQASFFFTVAITGSIYLKGSEYLNCLKKDPPEKFKKCNDKLLREVKNNIYE